MLQGIPVLQSFSLHPLNLSFGSKMVAYTTLLSLAVSAPLLAVSGLALKREGCSLSNVKLTNLPSPLVAPTAPASFVGIAIGTQNYTCNSAGTYT